MPRPAIYLLALSLVGCATTGAEPDPCGPAAALLDECQGGAPEGFVASCQSDETGELRSTAAALVEAGCSAPPPMGKADSFGENAFVAVCIPAVLAGYAVDLARNGKGSPMSAELKAFLRPHYGALVDQVRVTWSSKLLDNWTEIGIDFNKIGGQTFGNAIFVSAGQNARSVLAHELQHAKQARDRGGVVPFAHDYCKAYYSSDYRYSKNALEIEAYNVEQQLTGRR